MNLVIMNRARRFSSATAAPVRLAGDERGVSAVEFALLLPLMVTLYLGGVEISQAHRRRPQGDADRPHASPTSSRRRRTSTTPT